MLWESTTRIFSYPSVIELLTFADITRQSKASVAPLHQWIASFAYMPMAGSTTLAQF
jgi:hypothetical protein